MPRRSADTDRSTNRTSHPLLDRFRENLVANVVLVLCVVVAVACMTMMVLAVFPRSERISVADMTWMRSVSVFESRPVRHEGWELPEGSTLVSAEKRPYQYVRRMYEFQGRPVYADWYVYETVEPVVVSSPTRSGRKGEEVADPEVSLSDGQSLGGGEQELAVISADGRRYVVDWETWDAVSVGDEVALSVSPEGRVLGVA